ncbi:hypothetical protein HDU92_006989, partial [Lobulomyces angularis]
STTTGLLREQKIECEEAFALFDRDKDGKINNLELGAAMRTLGHDVTSSDIKQWTGSTEEDDLNTFTDLKTFLELMTERIRNVDPETEISQAFQFLDRDNRKVISPEELKYFMTNLGEKLTDEEADEMLRNVELDADGNITYDTFLEMMRPR